MPFGLAHFATESLLIGSGVILVAAALHDLATRTVPNWMPLCILVAGFGLRVLQGGLGLGLLIALGVFALTVIFWRRGWMGGADVKLLTATALVVPPGLSVFNLALSISLAGGVLYVIYFLLHTVVGLFSTVRPAYRRPDGLFARICRVEGRRIRRLESLPYASAIAVGALTVLFSV